jgi:uncharacterized LabA/DUF88 family protein
MARVALFFDGKNHMKDLRLAAEDRWIDHGALARWMVEHVGGTEFAFGHYYTGVPGPGDDQANRGALSDLLTELEKRPGFFVHRFTRVSSSWVCTQCGHLEPFTREKQVDTQLVADVIMGAVRNTYDIAVVFSGDLDVAPALDAAHALGKKVWIATFGQVGISRSLQRAAWGLVDLKEHLDHYAHGVPREHTESLGDPTATDSDVLRELARAQAHFTTGGGFVGAQYFLHRWRGQGVSDDPELRRMAVERLMQVGLVERYEVNGRAALRVAERVDLRSAATASADEDQGEE